MKTATTALLGLTLLLTAGCAAKEGDNDDRLETTPGFATSPTQEMVPGELTAGQLYGHSFAATSVRGDAATEELMDGVAFRLTSHNAGSVGVRADCNSLGLALTLDNGTATLTWVSSTKKACEEDRHAEQDAWLTTFFTSSPQQWTWDGAELVLTHEDTTVTMKPVEK